jgi:toxin-antitoxin system PIN domain toxin
MELPDVNVLIYAFRGDVPQHQVARAWLENTVGSEAPFALSKLALSAVVRIATNPRAFVVPSALEDVFGFCRSLLDQPNSRLVEPGERHWDIFRRLCIDGPVAGPRVTDAWYAALAIEHGCEWVTMDRDFRRFPGLKWRRP